MVEMDNLWKSLSFSLRSNLQPTDQEPHVYTYMLAYPRTFLCISLQGLFIVSHRNYWITTVEQRT